MQSFHASFISAFDDLQDFHEELTFGWRDKLTLPGARIKTRPHNSIYWPGSYAICLYDFDMHDSSKQLLDTWYGINNFTTLNYF